MKPKKLVWDDNEYRSIAKTPFGYIEIWINLVTFDYKVYYYFFGEILLDHDENKIFETKYKAKDYCQEQFDKFVLGLLE